MFVVLVQLRFVIFLWTYFINYQLQAEHSQAYMSLSTPIITIMRKYFFVCFFMALGVSSGSETVISLWILCRGKLTKGDSHNLIAENIKV